MTRSFHIVNFGCRASQSEGASIHQELIESRAAHTGSAFDADVVVVNSCTVTDEADRQVRQTIRRIASRNPNARIVVTGCYAQRAPEELAGMPQVRYVLGNSHKPLAGQIAFRLFEEDIPTQGRAEIFCSSIFVDRALKPSPYLGSGGRTRAVVKVQDGCNANCSFCVIPAVRGRSRSTPPQVVLGQVRKLAARGFKEVVFSGIHLGSYGRDLHPKMTLYDLVSDTLRIPVLERLRLSSIEPLEVGPEIVDLIAESPRMAHHFHIPLQSGSARVLRAMRRPYTPEYYAELVRRIRVRIPDASIGADVMAGFPGETDRDFEATYGLIEDSDLTYLHVFPFSPRPGTVAAAMPNQVPDHVARFRARALRKLIARKNEQFRRSMLGTRMDVLVLEDDSALSSNFIKVELHPVGKHPVNQWIPARATDLTADGVQASRITTAQEANRS